MAESTHVRWPTDWWVAKSWFVDGKREGSAVVHSPTSGYGFPVTVHIPINSDDRPDLDGLLARLRLDPAEVEALRKRVDEWEDRYSNLLRQYEALLRGATIRVKEDPEFEALRWLAKVVETSGAWLRSKSGPQPKAILAALAEWRRVRGLPERSGGSDA